MTTPEGKAAPKKPIDKPQMGPVEQEIVRSSQAIRTNPFDIFDGAEDFPELLPLSGFTAYPVDRDYNIASGANVVGIKAILFFSTSKKKGLQEGLAIETGFPVDQARAFADHLAGIAWKRKNAPGALDSKRKLSRSMIVSERTSVGFSKWLIGLVNALDPDVVNDPSPNGPPDDEVLYIYLRPMEAWETVMWLRLEVEHALEVARRLRHALDLVDTSAQLVDQTLSKPKALAAMATKDPAQQRETIGGALRYDPGMAHALTDRSPEPAQVVEQPIKPLGGGADGGATDGAPSAPSGASGSGPA